MTVHPVPNPQPVHPYPTPKRLVRARRHAQAHDQPRGEHPHFEGEQ